MNWEELLKGLSFITVGSFTIVAVLGFVTKSIFKYWLNNSASNYKKKLDEELAIKKNELDHQLEMHKSKWEKDKSVLESVLREKVERRLTEYQVKFNSLHMERAVIIKKIYKELFILSRNLQRAYSIVEFEEDMDSKGLRMSIAQKSFDDFYHTYYENRILFNDNLCERLDIICSHVIQILSLTGVYNLYNMPKDGSDFGDKQYDAYQKCVEIVQGVIPDTSKELEDEFRKLLGVIPKEVL
ncbi:hypothetical protein ACE106_16665 [Shouchella clausii]|uniref:hypothetical protein n=1 Tax=Shouchella clausii TaxID=79880 RepID=UPI000BA64AFB|nr:hypothetical protein [Shouchella clausii]PAD46666.1 hypothetical protein CHI09_11100 [Shouchella clausii]